jgi:hypothetical protein
MAQVWNALGQRTCQGDKEQPTVLFERETVLRRKVHETYKGQS